ncbi:MAG: hypothetical protein CFE38_00915 [Comamonadaceae bacterium PBBC1]|nr:MAG: hypothetical protein CFE38_00915 [Comamonadaceae bacterium PBBC1]
MSNLPSDWSIAVLRSAADSTPESFIDGDWIEAPYITDKGIRLIQTGNIGRSSFIDKSDTKKYISLASFRLLNCKWVNAGDLLICRLADPIGRACEIPPAVGDAITSVDCTIFRVAASRFNKRFVLHWLNSDENLKNAADNAAGSTRSRISRSNLGKLPIPQPNLNEQGQIAQILDTLDTVIHETEAIIAKRKAVKQGLLHDLLKRGIDANGELRPPQSAAPHLYKQSPLGWIPNEWEVRPLSSCIASLDAGVSVNSEDRPHGASEIGVLKTSALSQGVFHPDQNKTVVAKEVRLAREPVEGDSILVSRMNTPQLVGASCYVAEPWPTLFLPDRIWQLKKTAPDSVHMRWLSYVFLTSNFRAYVEVHATGTSGSMKNLPKSRLREMPVAFPNLDEQMLIAGCLAKADDVVTSEAMQLEKLTAEKSGLMDDLLTGRVRVTPLLEAAP